MSYKVVVSEYFKRNAKFLNKKYHSIRADVENLISSLEMNPLQGTPLGKDCYKVRLAISSKGRERAEERESLPA